MQELSAQESNTMNRKIMTDAEYVKVLAKQAREAIGMKQIHARSYLFCFERHRSMDFATMELTREQIESDELEEIIESKLIEARAE